MTEPATDELLDLVDGRNQAYAVGEDQQACISRKEWESVRARIEAEKALRIQKQAEIGHFQAERDAEKARADDWEKSARAHEQDLTRRDERIDAIVSAKSQRIAALEKEAETREWVVKRLTEQRDERDERIAELEHANEQLTIELEGYRKSRGELLERVQKAEGTWDDSKSHGGGDD